MCTKRTFRYCQTIGDLVGIVSKETGAASVGNRMYMQFSCVHLCIDS